MTAEDGGAPDLARVRPLLRIEALGSSQLLSKVLSPRWAAARAVSLFVAIRLTVFVVALSVAHAAGRPGMSVFERWDAQWYAGIARHGYGFVRVVSDGRHLSDYAFFPLYPMLERLVSDGTGLTVLSAGLVIASVSAIVAAAGIHAVASAAIGPRAASIATVAWALVPVGFIETMAYSESLFTALAAWALRAAQTKRYAVALVLSCLAGLTRPIGIAVACAVAIAIISERGAWRAPLARSWRAWLPALVIAPLGTIAYLVWVSARLGSPYGYFHVASGWGNTFDGGVGFARWVIGELDGPTAVFGILLVLGLLVLVATSVRLSTSAQRLLPEATYACVIVALALSTSGYFGSRPRYLLPAFPLLFPIAQWLSRRSRRFVAAVSVVALTGACVAASLILLGSGPP